MYMTILYSAEQRELGRTYAIGNQEYLERTDEAAFPVLSGVSRTDYEVFGQDDMPRLLLEVQALLASKLLGAAAMKHVAEVENLATQCAATPGATLCITPFHPDAPDSE